TTFQDASRVVFNGGLFEKQSQMASNMPRILDKQKKHDMVPKEISITFGNSRYKKTNKKHKVRF
ncbi:MAG: hypothetical protein ABW185_05295, partial [Sedimenticola sp.]